MPSAVGCEQGDFSYLSTGEGDCRRIEVISWCLNYHLVSCANKGLNCSEQQRGCPCANGAFTDRVVLCSVPLGMVSTDPVAQVHSAGHRRILVHSILQGPNGCINQPLWGQNVWKAL